MKRMISLLLAVLMVFSIVPIPEAAAEYDSVFVLPAGLQEVEEQAFAGNSSISKLVIPSSVTSIGREAFADCTGLTEVSIAGTDVSIDGDAFLNCSRDAIFYAHDGSSAMLWALSHGFKCISLDDESDYLGRFSELLAHSGFDPSLLMSSTFASRCLIVRTPDAMECLPDISEYNPIDIFRSDEHLYYIQFEYEGDAESCFNYLHGNSGIFVEPDRIGAADDVSAQGVTLTENWGTNDIMGFDVYAPFVAQHRSGEVTIAVIDSGVRENSWGGPLSNYAVSFVDANALTDSIRHGSKVASIINDCLGANRSNVTLLPIKVVNSSSMYRTSVIIESIKYAASHGADIINLSLGWDISEGTSPELERQLKAASDKGILIVAAAGNGSGNVMYPASCDGVLAVSALTYSEESGYSVRSRTGSEIDYTAPGMYLATSMYNPVDPAGDVIGTASTSFAAPQIVAALALIKMDSTQNNNPIAALDHSCLDLTEEGLLSSAFGHGLPKLDNLAKIRATDIRLKNMDGDSLPSRLWLADKDNDFLMSWTIVPSSASDKTVTVTSNKPSVVSVRQYGNTSALITAKSTGTAVITVSNGNIVKEHTLVVEKPVSEILLTGIKETMIVNREADIAAAILPEDANNRRVVWKSSNEMVASVSQTGHVNTLNPGKTMITCEAEDGYGTKAQIELTVIEVPPPVSISLSAKEKEIVDNAVTMEVGEILTLEKSILPEDALQECRFSVFPYGVVSVSEDGIVTALESGAGKSTTIVATATSGNNVYTGLTVSVVISPTEVGISSDKTTIDIDETTALSATVLPENATDKTVTWTSMNPAVATVDSRTGLVKAIAPGSAEIVCTTANGKESSVTITVRRPITVVLDSSGGTCDVSALGAYSGYEIGSLPIPARDYWSFDGWFSEKSGGEAITATSVFAEDTTIFAHWTGLPYQIVFNPNGGSCDLTTKTAHVGAKAGELPTPSRDYYSFTGWFTEAVNGEEVTADYIRENDTELPVYAHWSSHPYTVTFVPNGGTCIPLSKAANVDSPIGELPEPERQYYIFDGWYKSDSEQITKEYTQSTTASLTVYAHWTPMKYTMTFDANGGSCDTKAEEFPVDTDIGELPNPSRPYYDFEGWYTTDGETHITATYRQEKTDAVTVQAKWRPHTYTMKFDPNGGNCDKSITIGTVDEPVVILPVPTKNYYTWNGWYTVDGLKIESNYVHNTDEDITVYAQWTPNKYTMTFDPNGGSVSPNSKQGTVDAAIGTLPTPTRPYYTSLGWFTAKSGGTQITEEYIHVTDSAVTVYAHWKPGTYTIALNANGGKCSKSSITGTVDAVIGDLPVPTRDYYDFTGWFTAATGGTKVTSDYKQGNTNNLTLYAQWTPKSYDMKFNANGRNATTPVSIKTYYVDSPVGELPTPTRSYYTFNGWYTASSGGTKITTAYKHPTTTAITAYAQWTPNTFSLKFNPSGGSCSTSSKSCSVDTAVGTLPTPTKTGYVFLGWFTSTSGGSQVTTSTVYDKDQTVTVYAQWKEDRVTYRALDYSTNGTYLGTRTISGLYGTSSWVNAGSYNGYSGSSQQVSWDSKQSKDIRFNYTPNATKASQGLQDGTWWTSSSNANTKILFSVNGEWQNRTANSVQVRIVWTQTITGGYFGYNQEFNAEFWHNDVFYGNTGNVRIASTSTWPYSKRPNSGSVTAYSDWITVPLNTTNQTSVIVKCVWSTGSNDGKPKGSWGNTPIVVPAY